MKAKSWYSRDREKGRAEKTMRKESLSDSPKMYLTAQIQGVRAYIGSKVYLRLLESHRPQSCPGKRAPAPSAPREAEPPWNEALVEQTGLSPFPGTLTSRTIPHFRSHRHRLRDGVGS